MKWHKKSPVQRSRPNRATGQISPQDIVFLRLLYRRRKEKAMRKKPEYKIIWVTPPDPVKLGTIMGEIYARGRGLEFVGLVPNEKNGAKHG